jgi:predicted RNA-binding Zn-ribbon protein involved in translation (DUF1610 family)
MAARRRMFPAERVEADEGAGNGNREMTRKHAKLGMRPVMDSGMTMSCGRCGETADAEAWTRTAVAGELPRNRYQCPGCGFAFERRHGKATVMASGFVMPGPVTLVPVEGML